MNFQVIKFEINSKELRIAQKLVIHTIGFSQFVHFAPFLFLLKCHHLLLIHIQVATYERRTNQSLTYEALQN